MPKHIFSMHWMFMESINDKGQMEYNNNNEMLEIILPCTSTDGVNAYQWLSECNVGQLLRMNDISGKVGTYKIMHREFSVERVKIKGGRAPSYIFDLVFLHGHKIETFELGSKCSLTPLFGENIPSKDYYKLCQWDISINATEAIITLPKEFRYIIMKPKYINICAFQHNGKADIIPKGDNLLVTSKDFGKYIVEIWVKSNVKSMTRKNRLCRKNVTKKNKKK